MEARIYQNTADMTQLYDVTMTCGHVEKRRMRPSTAGQLWPQTTPIIAGAKCSNCDPCKPNHCDPAEPCEQHGGATPS